MSERPTIPKPEHSPVNVTQRALIQGTRLDIVKEGHEVLATECQYVTEITPFIWDLATDMVRTLMTPGSVGIGLAANQVGQLKRLIVMQVDKKSFECLINPEIVGRGNATVGSLEGCLSVPGKKYNVKRNKSVRVLYTDLNGEERTKQFTRQQAMCVQHEIDHLNGVLISDRGQLQGA